MFNHKYFALLLLLPSFIWQAVADDLINARCQSKCLYELEMRHRNNSESRRLLRHQISTLCKEDVLCASCIIPCRDLISDAQICGRTLCTGISEPNQCHQSCAFLSQIANNKPGQCPKSDQKISNVMDSECSAFCDSDGDCPEIDKCCSIGCSRTCLGPLLNDSRLLPKPEGISVQERKRKKSAILRWIMKRLTPQHTSTNSNLYVIQWRWSIHKQPETMTPWQTVMVRNKMYAILKHLLAPGRFYLFRVAAVNLFGTYGFSQPSHPAFKLSKEVKAPSAPINLTVLQVPNGVKGFAKIGWTPPDSELPIKEYRLSWWKSSMEMANAFEFRQRRSSKGTGGTTTMDDDYDGGAGEMAEIDGNLGERRNLVLPNYSTKAELNGLEGGKVYMVELYATVDSSEGELRGEPAILFLKTEERRLTTTSTINPNGMNGNGANFEDDGTETGPFIAELKTPFFEGGRLKTILSWLEHPNCEENKLRWQKGGPQFRVLIRSMRCLNQLPPQQFTVQGCVATLENLQFNCEYYVRVEEFGGGGGREKEKSKLIARLTFSTLPCEQTPSDVSLECESDEQQSRIYSNDQIGMAQPLESPSSKPTIGPQIRTTTKKTKNSQKVANNGKDEDEWLPIEELDTEELTKKAEKPKEQGTKTASVVDKNNKKEQSNQQLSCLATSQDTAECSWNWPQNFEQKNNPLIGFRTVLSSTLTATPWNVTIVGPEQRRMHLTMLNPKAIYRFRLQAVTAHGLGAELVEHFSTVHFPSSKTMNLSMDLGIQVGGGGQFPEIVELPWGSSSTSCIIPSNLSKFLLFTAIFLIMFFNHFC